MKCKDAHVDYLDIDMESLILFFSLFFPSKFSKNKLAFVTENS